MEMKISCEDIRIPTIRNYREIALEKYTLKDLKYISKIYKLKTTLKKGELINNIRDLIHKSIGAIKIQSVVRRWFVKSWILSHGPAMYKRDCVNDADFLTMEKVEEIPNNQFFSYEEEEITGNSIKKYIYGFDIVSIYNLLKTDKPINPYNRKEFKKDTLKQITKLINLSKLLNIQMDLNIEDEITEKSFDFRCLDLFQSIDELGNYTSHLWFSSLSRRALTRFLRELNDVWFYRCQLTREIHNKICPRGNPFRNINFYRLFEDSDDFLKEKVLKIMEEMVYSGVDTDSRCLGSYYVLGCLTLVNIQAANAMPWLYENFII